MTKSPSVGVVAAHACIVLDALGPSNSEVATLHSKQWTKDEPSRLSDLPCRTACWTLRKTMQWIAAAIGICLSSVVSGVVYGQSTSETTIAAKPRVYALIAAIGEQFTVVYEVSTTGTHLSPYRRRTSEVSDNVLNRFALNSLDDAIVKIDPAGKRIYMTLPAAQMDGVEPSKREDLAIGRIIAALEKMPERAEWDRI